MSTPSKVKNPWACENDQHGSGFIGMELEIYLCPRCGAHPTMAVEDSVWQDGGTGLLCMECGFGTRPQKDAVRAVTTWNKAVEQYCNGRAES